MGVRRNLGAALTMGTMATTRLKDAQNELRTREERCQSTANEFCNLYERTVNKFEEMSQAWDKGKEAMITSGAFQGQQLRNPGGRLARHCDSCRRARIRIPEKPCRGRRRIGSKRRVHHRSTCRGLDNGRSTRNGINRRGNQWPLRSRRYQRHRSMVRRRRP